MLNKRLKIISEGKTHQASRFSGIGTGNSKLTQILCQMISKICLHGCYMIQLLDRTLQAVIEPFVHLFHCWNFDKHIVMKKMCY